MKQNTNENAANRTSYVGYVYNVGEKEYKNAHRKIFRASRHGQEQRRANQGARLSSIRVRKRRCPFLHGLRRRCVESGRNERI